MTFTLKDAAAQYRDNFGLKGGREMLGHDALHAMTGLGIGLADEMRIALIEATLCGEFNGASLPKAMQKMQKTLTKGKVMTLLPFLYVDEENSIEKWKFRFAQCQTKPLTQAEVEQQIELGRQIDRSLLKLTGYPYTHMPEKVFAAIDFSKIDFSVHAQAIKHRHQTPENRAVAVKSAKILRDAAKQQRGDIIPPRAGRSCLEGRHVLRAEK